MDKSTDKKVNADTLGDEDLFSERCKELFSLNGLGDLLDDEKISALYSLTALLLEKNSEYNLTSITDIDGIITKHYIDSLLVAPYLPKKATLIDIGSGAGFPALPLALFRPDLKITAVEATGKKTAFIELAAKTLKLKSLTVLNKRAEELIREKSGYRESFDAATARAVASVGILSELAVPYLKTGGMLLAMKAKVDRTTDETFNARVIIAKLGGGAAVIEKLALKTLDNTEEERCIVQIKKIAETPDIYPRAYAKILKNAK